MSRDFPESSDALDMVALQSAIAECFVALEIVGRRVAPDVTLNEVSSIADFGLNVAIVRGEPIPDWKGKDLAALPVFAVLDGVSVARGTGAMVLGHPLNALFWLAGALHSRGEKLLGGALILTGTCTGVIKVGAGQEFAGLFADFEPVRVRLA